MEISPSLYNRAVTALWIKEDDGHWQSTLTMDARKYRLRDRGKRVSQLLVLWTILNGQPTGFLSNACGMTECVNPYHYRDQDDRNQSLWRESRTLTYVISSGVFGEEESRIMQLLDIVGESPQSIENNYGMTSDFGCYACGQRFDPLVTRNKVLCDECWTAEDQYRLEQNYAG